MAERYIRGAKLPDYKGYCPIVKIWGDIQEDGRFQCYDYNNLSFSEDDFVKSPGFVVIHIAGAIEREFTVETASSALHASLKSLFAACNIPVDFERIRTSIELSEFMKAYRANYSHIILIGHGAPNGISFLDRAAPLAGAELSGFLGSDMHDTPIQILSLCCHSGCESISRALSSAANVTEVLAPAKEFDIRWAVHFVISYFLNLYINGMSVEDAVAKSSDAAHTTMCIWRNGKLQEPCPANKTCSSIAA